MTSSRASHPLGVIKAVKQAGIEEVIVAYSAGKDSLAVLELCVEHFKRVVPYFMYVVPGLEFQEQHMRYVEERYDLKILRVPDWRLGGVLRNAICRHQTQGATTSPKIKWRDVEQYIRQKTGLHWIASGERCADSLQRRGMIVASDGICPARGHFYPVGWWRTQDIASFLSMRNVLLSSEYRIMSDGHNFGGIGPRQLYDIKKHYPEDFKKILKLFPLAEIQVVRRQIMMDEEKAISDAAEAEKRKIAEEKQAIKDAERDERRKVFEAKKAARDKETAEKKAERKAAREAAKLEKQQQTEVVPSE